MTKSALPHFLILLLLINGLVAYPDLAAPKKNLRYSQSKADIVQGNIQKDLIDANRNMYAPQNQQTYQTMQGNPATIISRHYSVSISRRSSRSCSSRCSSSSSSRSSSSSSPSCPAEPQGPLYLPISKNIAFADLANQIINQYPVQDMSFIVLHLGQPVQNQANNYGNQRSICSNSRSRSSSSSRSSTTTAMEGQANNGSWFGVIFPNPANANVGQWNQFVGNAAPNAPNNNQL